jgi:carotenoid cleavage dioxygenase-like enzyme
MESAAMPQAQAVSARGLGFTSLEEEILEPISLALRGELPDWLDGVLLRTGPSQFEVGDRSYRHWFDGLAMLHRFSISGGQISYANRFLQSAAYRAAHEHGAIGYREFATDPCFSLFGRLKAFFGPPKFTDNANVAVQVLDGKYVAMTEAVSPIIFDPETLETLGVFGYDKRLAGQVTTAHPHYDFGRTCEYNYVLQFGRHSVYNLFRLDAATGRQESVAELPVKQPAYMHSFGMTEQYLILTEFPLLVDPLRLRFSGRPFIENYRWWPERGLKFHVIEKDSGRVIKTATTEACFAFHHVNAFERDGWLVVDIVTFPDARVLKELYLDRLRAGEASDTTGRLTRFELPLVENTLPKSRLLATEPIELPRINYSRVAGQPYRFVWGVGDSGGYDFASRLIKVDVTNGEKLFWQETGCYPGEPVFVAAPSAGPEDEGVVLSVVLDALRGNSFLLVLDAATLSERARAEVPHHIPFHFHGNFFARSSDRPSRTVHR